MTTTKTVTGPFVDTRSRRRTADWLVLVRQGAVVQTYRFADEAAAQAFADDQTGGAA